jgi:hypothetical protein
MSDNNTALEIGKQVFETKELQLTGQQIMAQMQIVDWIKKEIMKENVHFGKPFGGSKDTLYKPGADKLLMTFRVQSVPTVEDLSGPDEIRYRITAVGYHITTGQQLGTGVGECSSNEEKYKWRAAVSEEEFEKTPADRKRVKYAKEGGENIKQIRTNPADVANTVLKMADKRANTALAIKVTAASDIFDQDLEDMEDANYQRTNKNGGTKPKGTPTSSGTEGNFHIKNWTSKNGGNADKPWTKYTISTEEGASFNTFNESHKNEALRLKNAGLVAHIVWKKSQYGSDMVSIAEGKEPEPEKQPEQQPASQAASQPPRNANQSAPPRDDSDVPPEMRRPNR